MAVDGGAPVAAGQRRLKAVPAAASAHGHRSSQGDPAGLAPDATVDQMLARVARGDEPAFERLYDAVAGQVHGLVRRVLRDPAQAEEVTQEVFLEIWRTATRFDPTRGKADDLGHDHGARPGGRPGPLGPGVQRPRPQGRHRGTTPRRTTRLPRRSRPGSKRVQVRSCLGGLTDLQRESVSLAYYGGYTYNEVAELLSVPLGTVKTRLRDGLIRMRDCMGVEA